MMNDALTIHCTLCAVILRKEQDKHGTYVLVYTSDNTKMMAYEVLWSGKGFENHGVWYEALSISRVSESVVGMDERVVDYAIIIASIGSKTMEEQYYSGFTANWHVRHKNGKYSLPNLDSKLFSIYTNTNSTQ